MNKLQIKIPSEVSNICTVENFIENFTTTFDLSSKLLGRISLSVIQAFSNAVTHGNGRDITKMVTVVAEKIDNKFKVTVSDEGKGFDYTKIPDPISLENIDDKSKRGLFLMKELSDDLIFENNGATVIMIFVINKDIKLNVENYELFAFCHDFIKLNKDITNEQIPDMILEYWSTPDANADKDTAPSDAPLMIFVIIVDLYNTSRKEGEEKLKLGSNTYLFNQFFYTFQVVLAATLHSRKYDIPIEPFQLFMIEKYHIPKIEEPKQLYLEYMRLTQSNDSSYSTTKKGRGKTSNTKQLEISFPPQSNQLLLIESFVWNITSYFQLPFILLGRINLAMIESINHAVLCVNENDTKEQIKVIATKTKKQFKVTVLYGTQSLSPKPCKINYSEPIKDDDLKERALYFMKNIPDKISFFDNGAEVRLTFKI